jgi:non-ribosomal peptide synthetase component F
MILSDTQQAEGTGATLDDLFRRAGVRRPDALALIDPPNGETITGGAPRRLTYAEADRAISALAAKLRRLSLQTDMVVAMQLANTVDSVIALLGVLRAGMIAAPLPLLWREQEMVAALSRIGAKAIVTSSHVGLAAQSEIAMQVAAELFPIRHICGFGRDLPDGVVPLDDVFNPAPTEFYQPSVRPGPAAAHVAAITFDVTGDGLVPVARSQSELIAGGLAVFREAGIAENATILSTIPAASFAGIALTLMPWLLAGGTLALHHGFDPAVFAEQSRAHEPCSVVLPGPALALLADAGLLGGHIKNILALWHAPEQLAAAVPWQRDAALVDIASFDETGLLPARRGPDGLPAPIPHGAFVAPVGITTVGGYRFRQREVDAVVAGADPAAVIVALPDAHLCQRFAGSAQDGAALAAKLQARGVNSLIAAAFLPRGNAACSSLFP